MRKNKLEKLEFYTSLTSAILVYMLVYLQYSKGNEVWWLILIAAILMTANTYVKYKKINKL
ncbi:hypothetical protein [uncultured Anaerococcus sp.]|uniref:hypothetical protein n=1 Tax=uncultured Anaerococcus sp. TaxID=293428 RepID=UPI00288BF908|nr:hypothetical protein [uncultured Anaerococcus sp.]